MLLKPLPTRRGRPVCLTLDEDAEMLLRAMAPHGKGLGSLVCELIRKEARECGERHKLVKTLVADATREARDD